MPKPKILIVEDDKNNLELLAVVLSTCGFEVVAARTGAEGIAAARKEKPALILMDMQMPVMDGYTATRHLKADPETASIPVVAVTAYALTGDMEKALAAGCVDYITKPINTRDLPERLKQILARTGHDG
jgi:two-component system cell cycle response regulator DivK